MSKEALRVLIWPDYAIRGVEELFFAATGLGVEWSFFDQNEEAFARFRAAPERFDVVLADGMWPQAYWRAGLIQSFDLSVMRGWSELIPAAQRWCAKAWVSGVGSLIAFPCFWGLRGIVYDPDVVRRPESWSALLGAPRRSLWLNSQGSEVIAEIALGMGVAPGRVYQLTGDELAQVGRRLAQLAPSVGGIWRVLSELVNAFEAGAALAEVHTTSLLDNVERALGKPLAATIPAEGTIAYIDGAMIGSACRNLEAAMLFVDILSSPEGVLAQWRESDGYPCANAIGLESVRRVPESRSKLDRSGATPDALERAVIYSPPTDLHGYMSVWRSFIGALDAPIPVSVREAVGLSG